MSDGVSPTVWFSSLSVFGFQGTAWRLPPPMGLSGLEPPTSRLSGVRSNRLSYKPMMEMEGIEPLTPCLQGRCSPS